MHDACHLLRQYDVKLVNQQLAIRKQGIHEASYRSLGAEWQPDKAFSQWRPSKPTESHLQAAENALKGEGTQYVF